MVPFQEQLVPFPKSHTPHGFLPLPGAAAAGGGGVPLPGAEPPVLRPRAAPGRPEDELPSFRLRSLGGAVQMGGGRLFACGFSCCWFDRQEMSYPRKTIHSRCGLFLAGLMGGE